MPSKARLITAASICGMLAPPIFTGAWIVGGLLQTGYSARREDISALAALDADSPWVVIAGLFAAGALTLVFATGLRVALGRGIAASTGCALVAVVGVGLIGLGTFRNDCSSVTSACEARADAGHVSWQHTTHDLLSAPVFAAAVFAPLVLSLRFRRDPHWRPLAVASVALAPVLALLFLLGGLDAVPGWNGVLQRTSASLAFLWLEAAALFLLRDTRGRM